MKNNNNEIDMLRGPLLSKMLLFAVPLIASGLLQQSFNAVDVAVVGRFAGSHALAAVGANGPVLGLIVNLFLGISVGINVVIANYIGNKNAKGVRASVAASAVLSIICSIILLVAGQLVARPLLELLATPQEIMDEALEYLRILVGGMPFLIIFNFGAAILRSIGDTKRPFFALIAAGIVNVALNLFFVIILGMGVAGVAWGTVISTAVNAAIIVAILVREKSDIKLDFSNLRTGFSEIGKICRVGLPAGLQSTIFAFSNVFVLSAINTFGSFAVAGSATAINYEFYCYFVINAIGQTAVAFASQNYGAGQYDRVKRIFRLSILLSVGLSAFLNILIAWQGEFFLSAFTQDPQVLVYALQRIHYVLLFQWIACYYEMAGQIMRALGRSMTPALITIFGTCVVRLIWVAYFPANAPFYRLMTVYPVTWTLTSILMAVAFSALSRRMLNEKSVENTTKIGYIEENA